MDGDEIYDEVSKVPDPDADQKLKTSAWFLENKQQFKMLKKLSLEKKMNVDVYLNERSLHSCWCLLLFSVMNLKF